MNLSLIYKQWHRAPNRKKTPASNCGHLRYIGQRVHVMKSEDKDNGLFGRINGSFTNDVDLEKETRYLHKLSRNQTTVYRSVISFKQETVDHLEMYSAEQWQSYTEYNARILADKNGIKFENFEYLAAVHLKEGQPHVHIVFWDKQQQIGKSIVDQSVPDDIRKELHNSTFGENELEWIDEVDLEADSELMGKITADNSFYLLDNGNDVRKGIIKATFQEDIKKLNRESNNAEDIFRNAIQIAVDINPTDIMKRQLEKIIRLTPKTGSLKYINIVKFDVPLKTEIDRLTEMLINTKPEIAAAYNQYLENKSLLAEMFNSSENKAGRYEIAKVVGKAKDNLYALSGNRILQQVKKYLYDFTPQMPTGEYEMPPDFGDAPPENENFALPPDFGDVPPENENFAPPIEEVADEEFLPEREAPTPYIKWSTDYKAACKLIYDKSSDKPEYNSALRLLIKEHDLGNALAAFDIGKMYSSGLFDEQHKELANEYYVKAFNSFNEICSSLKDDDKLKPYIEYRIGKMHSLGTGTSQDYEQAFNYFTRSAEADNKFARFSLAGLYYYGNGIAQNYTSALSYYEKAATQGMPFAAYAAAQMYDYGTGCEVNRPQADSLYKQAFDGFMSITLKGDADDNTLYRLGTMLISGKGCSADITNGLEYIRKAAELDNKNALAIYARELAIGTNVPRDLTLSEQYYKQAIGKGNRNAVFEYGKLLMERNTFERDISKALPLLITAANENSIARYYLAKLYLRGEILEKNIPKSIELLSECVNDDNQFAIYTLASIYAYEDSFIDYGKALDLFRKAAELDNIYACYEIGKLAETHPELNIFAEEAQHYYKKAFDGFMLMDINGEGNDRLWLRIGCMYLKGNGVEKSVDTAMHWLKKSAEAGNETAQAIITESNDYLANGLLTASVRALKDFGAMCDASDRELHHTAATFGHGDLSEAAIKELIYKLKDKKNGIER